MKPSSYRYRQKSTGRTLILNPFIVDDVYIFCWDDAPDVDVEWSERNRPSGQRFDDLFEKVEA